MWQYYHIKGYFRIYIYKAYSEEHRCKSKIKVHKVRFFSKPEKLESTSRGKKKKKKKIDWAFFLDFWGQIDTSYTEQKAT